jgi:putative colanic acid biosynthesis UDP-glucose lipid carrier transferase
MSANGAAPDGGRRAPAGPEADGGQVPRMRFGDTPSVGVLILERVDLFVVVLTLFGCLLAFQEPLTVNYAGLAGVTVILCGRFITRPDMRSSAGFGERALTVMPRLLMEWGTVVGFLLFTGFALKISDEFSRAILLTWFAVTAVALLVAQELQAQVSRWLQARGAFSSSYVVVGLTRVGRELVKRIPEQTFLGFFDFRSRERLAAGGVGLPEVSDCALLGDFVRQHAVAAVYIALPIGNAPRIRDVLADLRDSTASVYFVPDLFAFDLIQGRVVDLNGIPALAILDTPLRGVNAFAKRLVDLALTVVALPVVLPVCLAIALAIKLTSPGPVLFAQRRYGMDGEEILVYKFRSMTVLEDGARVQQASRGDARITPLGRMLRRTSLDELPQLLNVLQGKMSLVGPRPHAVSHNEQYRRQIAGYMVRHKALPGITGWAQVHGLRGETDTVDKMAERVRYDLEYLRNWSLSLDLRILVKTVLVVVRGDNAY